MSFTNDDTTDLLRRAQLDDVEAIAALLSRYRPRLQRMVSVRLDARVAKRVDSSDIVQESLAEAAEKLSSYLAERPMAFYPWLRRLTWQRLLKAFKTHIVAERRTITREFDIQAAMNDQSAFLLADVLTAQQASPSGQAIQEEMKALVRSELDAMKPEDRELLLLKYMEQLHVREIAEIMGISDAAVKMRHMRALQRLQSAMHRREAPGSI